MKIKRVISAIINKNTGIVTTGFFLGRAIYILFTFILARIYGPTEFGDLGVFLSISTIFSSIALLGMDQAVPIPSKREEIFGIISLGLLLSIVLPPIFAFLLIAFYSFLKNPIKILNENIFILLVANVMVISLFNILNGICIREKKFKIIAFSVILISVLTGVIQIIFSFFSHSSTSLILGVIWGRLLGVVFVSKSVWEYFSSIYQNLPKVFHTLRYTTKKYYKYPTIVSLSSLINTIGTNIAILFVNLIFGKEFAGFFLCPKES